MNTIRTFICALNLFAAGSGMLSTAGQPGNWDAWSWEAPNPPLPFTEWYDYGWDSTSNGPPPAGEIMASALTRPMASDRRLTRADPPLPPAPPQAKSLMNGISVSPYATVSFADFNGEATSGGGLDIGLNLSKTVQVVSFMESDNAEGSLVDRFGLGVQLTGKLGRWLKPFARLSVGYNFEGAAALREDRLFVRPQFGAILDIWRKKNWHASVTGSWALDVDTEGNAAQRLFGGIVLGTSF